MVTREGGQKQIFWVHRFMGDVAQYILWTFEDDRNMASGESRFQEKKLDFC